MLLLGIVLAVGHVALASWRATHGAADLVGFHETAVHWWRTGELTNAFGAQFYLPVFTVLIAPVAIWPLAVSGVLLGTINVLLFVLTVQKCRQLAANSERLPNPLAWTWPILLVFPFASGTIALGQVNLIVLWLCVLAYVQSVHNRPYRTGLLIALAGCLKIYPLIFSLYWLLKGQWRVTLGTWMGFLFLSVGLSLYAFSWQGTVKAHRQWLDAVQGAKYRSTQSPKNDDGSDSSSATQRSAGHQLIFTEQRTQWHRRNNQSLAVVVRRLTTDLYPGHDHPHKLNLPNLSANQAQCVYCVISATLLLLLSYVAWRRRQATQNFAEWSGWLASIVAFIPIYWTHYFVLLLPALICLSIAIWRRHAQGQRCWLNKILRASWLIGIVLLTWTPFQLIGGNAWLALTVMTWAIWRGDRELAEPSKP